MKEWAPDFSVPTGGWRDRQVTISIHPPSGTAFDAGAYFHLSHFRITDPQASLDLRWRVTLRLPDITAEQVPIGSTVIAPIEICDLLRHPPQQDDPTPQQTRVNKI